MALYEKMKKIITEWKGGEYNLSHGNRMDDPSVYGIRDKITIEGDDITMRLWDTDIVRYNKATKALSLDTGGWRTKTTRERMNMYLSLLNLPYSVDGTYETRRTLAGTWHLINEETKAVFCIDYGYIDIVAKEGNK